MWKAITDTPNEPNLLATEHKKRGRIPKYNTVEEIRAANKASRERSRARQLASINIGLAPVFPIAGSPETKDEVNTRAVGRPRLDLTPEERKTRQYAKQAEYRAKNRDKINQYQRENAKKYYDPDIDKRRAKWREAQAARKEREERERIEHKENRTAEPPRHE